MVIAEAPDALRLAATAAEAGQSRLLRASPGPRPCELTAARKESSLNPTWLPYSDKLIAKAMAKWSRPILPGEGGSHSQDRPVAACARGPTCGSLADGHAIAISFRLEDSVLEEFDEAVAVPDLGGRPTATAASGSPSPHTHLKHTDTSPSPAHRSGQLCAPRPVRVAQLQLLLQKHPAGLRLHFRPRQDT